MHGVVHFQERLQQPICQKNRLTNTTFNRSEVTCGNCIQKLKYQVRGPVDWDGAYKTIEKQMPLLQARLKEFFFAHRGIDGRASLENIPPQISLTFWFPAPQKSRRKIVMYNNSPTNQPNYIQVFIPTEDEMGEVATFVGRLGDELSLMPRRHPGNRETVPLSYQLRPQYRSKQS